MRSSLLALVVVVLAGCPTAQTPVDTHRDSMKPSSAADLFAGLPPPAVDAAQSPGEVLRLGPVPRPAAGDTALPFPPPQPEVRPQPPTPPPLEVVRHTPEGDVDLVGQVVVAFNQPVVPLASVGTLLQALSPLQLNPRPEGRFRWLDTRTLVFEPTDRMPFATRYEARVPAGFRASNGQVLSADHAWSFQTPPAEVVSVKPWSGSDQVRPDEEILLLFNAAVEPAQVARVLSLTAPGASAAVEVTRLTTGRPSDWPEPRSIRVKPRRPLALDTRWTLTLAAGLKSAEGPLPSTRPWTMSFRTYAPLKAEGVRCGWSWNEDEPCPPGAPLAVEFNNVLERQALAPFVEVKPKVDDLVLRGRGATIELSGSFVAETRYTVSVKAGLVDQFGQKLARAFSGQVTFGPAQAEFMLSGFGSTVVLEAGQATRLPGLAVNTPHATAHIAPVPLESIAELMEWVQRGDRLPLATLRPDAITAALTPTTRPNVAQGFGVELHPALDARGRGLVAVEVEVPAGQKPERHVALVQVTDLGLTATWSDEALHVLVASLSTGLPVANAQVELRHGTTTTTATTDARGLATLSTTGVARGRSALLVARTGDDAAFLDVGQRAEVGSPLHSLLQKDGVERLVGGVFTDRGAYRPGETAHVTGFVGLTTTGPTGDVVAADRSLELTILVRDARWKEVSKTTVTPGPFGMIGIDVPLPKDATLGGWHVSVTAGNRGSISGAFDVREYRVPEFRVATKAVEAPPHLAGKDATFEVEASYFFGGAMPQAPYTWSLSRADLDYRPPGNDGFRFGVAPPWWKRPWRPRGFGPQQVDSGGGQLDAQGRARVSTPLEPGDVQYPAFSYEFEAVVTDANRQRIASRTSLVAHRTLERVGVKVERSLVDAGAELPVEVIATDLDGRRVDGRKVRVALIELRPVKDPDAQGLDDEEEEEGFEDSEEPPAAPIDRSIERVEVGRCEVTTGESPVACRLRVPKAGEYVIRATLTTAQGDDAAEATVWATGKGTLPAPSEAAAVFILPDKETYEAGDTARVLVRSPFPVSRGFLVAAREGFAEVQPFETIDGTAVISFPVKEEWMPGIALQVVLSRGRQAPPPAEAVEDENRPRWATGEASLKVSLASRRLAVKAVADPATTRPGAEVAVNLQTLDAKGSPVSAGVTVMVVDEAVLSLTGFATPSPLEQIYSQRYEGIGAGDLRSLLLTRLKMPEVLLGGLGGAGYGRGGAMMKRSAPMAEMAAMAPEEEGGSELTVRKDFRSTAFFERTVTTDAAGRASVAFKLPDNLTEFRVMAVATDGAKRFGSGESRLVVRQPLIVRPSLPRFLNLGDRFEASAVVNNETGRDAEIVLRMLAANATIDAPLQTVKVAAGQAKEVRWHATAGVPGPAKFQVAAIELGEERFSDVAEIVVPTLLPATAEAFATYGSTQEAIVQPVSPPEDALPNFGGLQISMASTALTGLQDAARYLLDYPFHCVEQTASRLVPMLALGELLEAFELEGVGTAEERKKRVVTGIELLQQAQLGDGGFPSWAGGSISYTHLTAWVTFVLIEAKAAGYEVRASTVDRAIRFLVGRLNKPEHEWERHDHATRALISLVLARVNKADQNVMAELSALPDLPLFAKAWLLEAWAIVGDEARVTPLVKAIENAAVETAAAVHFSERRTEALRLIMHSDDRTDAIVLRALLKARPGHPLIEKVQRGLTKAQVNGRWSSTQANAWALLASRDYFRVFESETPAFDARAWVGDTYVGGERFEGRSTKTASVEVPMATLQDMGASDLLLSMKGEGRLYYRLGLRYAPSSLKLDALEAGFTVTRTYAAVDDPADVSLGEDGVWRVKAGKRVRVSLKVVASDRRYWVALVDPMPAGFEAVDEALATSGRVPSNGSYWRWSAWNHQELRDDQARAFADRMWAGVWDHDYVALATTPGEFVVPPARAEEMYAPETFGRSSTDRVVVVP